MSLSRSARHTLCVVAALVTLGVSSTAIAKPNLQGAWESGDGVGLLWTNGDNNVQSFRIYRREGASAPWQYIRGVAFAGALYQYTDASVPRGQELCYMIGARIAGQSGIRMSNQRCVTPASLPTRPSGVRLESVASDKVTIGWADASTNETGFRVQSRRWGVDTSWQTVHTAPASAGSGTRFTFEDTGVDMEYRTCYRVGANSAAGTTIWASIQCGDVPGWTSGTTLEEPLAMTKIESPGAGQIRVEWVENLTTSWFTVERYDLTDPHVTTVGSVLDHTSGGTRSVLSFTDTGLDTSRVYCYRVITSNARSNSLCTSPFDRAGGNAPSAPDLEVTATGNRRISYDWTVPADAIGALVMFYATNDGVASRAPESLRVGAGSYSDSIGYDIERNTRYCFVGVAYNRSGIAVSQPRCVTTLNRRPVTPENLHVWINSDVRMRWRWGGQVAGDVDEYEIRWTGRRAGESHDDGTATTSGSTYELFGIGGHRYCVQVRARNEVGVSPWSDEVCEVAAPERDDGTPDSNWSCGLGCDDGYHPEEETNILSCPDAQPAGATLCVENTARFVQCGLTCPDGYHAEQLGFTNECAVWADPASLNNQAACAENTGNFVQCGTDCPSGWQKVDSGTASFCKTTDVAPRDWVACVPE